MSFFANKRRAAGVTEKTYKKAGELLEKIRKLESFMFGAVEKEKGRGNTNG